MSSAFTACRGAGVPTPRRRIEVLQAPRHAARRCLHHAGQCSHIGLFRHGPHGTQLQANSFFKHFEPGASNHTQAEAQNGGQDDLST